MAIWKKRKLEPAQSFEPVSETNLKADPKPKPHRRRSETMKLRLSPDELKYLTQQAAVAGISRTDYIMAAVKGMPVIKVPGAAKVMANLSLCGNNLNQAVRLGHTAKRQGQAIDMAGIEKAVADLEETVLGFAEFLKKWNVELAEKTRKDVTKNANREMQCQQGNPEQGN